MVRRDRVGGGSVQREGWSRSLTRLRLRDASGSGQRFEVVVVQRGARDVDVSVGYPARRVVVDAVAAAEAAVVAWEEKEAAAGSG